MWMHDPLDGIKKKLTDEEGPDRAAYQTTIYSILVIHLSFV